MNLSKYLEDLGFIFPDDETLDLLNKNIRNLENKEYTIEVEGKRFIVGIIEDYFIYYWETLYLKSGWWDMHSHTLPKSKPVEISELILNTRFGVMDRKDESVLENDIEKLKNHLLKLGWQLSIPLLEKVKRNLKKIGIRYFTMGENLYEVFVYADDEYYYVSSVAYISEGCKKYRKPEDFENNLLVSVSDLIDEKIAVLNAEINKLEAIKKQKGEASATTEAV